MGHEKKVLRNVINALKSGGYDAAVVRYEGSGDSGQVEEIAIYKPGEEPQSDCYYHFEGLSDKEERAAHAARTAFLSDTQIEITVATSRFDHDKKEWIESSEDQMVPLLRGLDWLAYHWLRLGHPGWETDEGSYGHVIIRVDQMQMEMEYHERIVEVKCYSRKFSLGEEE